MSDDDLEWALEVLEEPLEDRPAWKGPDTDDEDYYRYNDAWVVVAGELRRLREERDRCIEVLEKIAKADGIPGFADRYRAAAQGQRRAARDLLDELRASDD